MEVQTDIVITFKGSTAYCCTAVVGAIFSDMFSDVTRGIAITLFSMGVFTGPLLAPFGQSLSPSSQWFII